MKISRAGKQQKACWKSERRMNDILEKEGIEYLELQSALRGHAFGWIAAVAWVKRQQKKVINKLKEAE